MSKIITGGWKQEEIKNASELFLKYKMPIPDMARIINRSAIDIKKKLIELKLEKKIVNEELNNNLINEQIINFIDLENDLIKLSIFMNELFKIKGFNQFIKMLDNDNGIILENSSAINYSVIKDILKNIN